jgi:short-subunit dehydrogenase
MNIIITGGTRGIGKSLVQLFAKEPKNRVLVTGRENNTLKSLSEKAEFKNIITLASDLGKLTTEVQALKEFVFKHFTDIDILINNAGILVSKEFTKTSENESREMMEVNFFAPATIIRTLFPIMKPGTHIVNISSMGGFQGSTKFKGLAIYSATKAAIACLTECLAEEFRDTGIKVNCLALGSVQTGMIEKAFPGYKAPVSAEDMAEYIMEFAMNGNRYFNGKIIPVAMNNP